MNDVHQSDSESDGDYVPPQDDKDSDSEQSDKEDNGKIAAVDEQGVAPDPETKKRTREALWSSFQASVSNAASSSSSLTVQEPRKVKIERRYRFAGEEVVEVVEVPDDSPEAKKWPLWKETLTESSTEAPTDVSLSTLPVPIATPSNPSSPADKTSNPAMSLASEPTSAPAKPPLKKPGPRKPKTTLNPLPGSSKAKKLSTLDKSAMDWQAHVHAEQDSGLKDELEANRRTGGFLEKVQFLKRVEERKDETLEGLKSKRRKL